MKRNVYFEGAKSMTFTKLFDIGSEQDGAIYGGYVFRATGKGLCSVLSFENGEKLSEFYFGDKDFIYPHSNAVFFGSERYAEDDEFPLLYSNVYNTYAKCEDRKEGVLCAYRIRHSGNDFQADLVQLIAVDFVNDTSLWKSPNVKDTRPYGNFVFDKENDVLYAFVMRDEIHKTAFFSFRMPKIKDGQPIGYKEVGEVRLRREDILDSFECDYVDYMQGATFHGGYIYSVEGFDAVASEAKPSIKIFDVNKKALSFSAPFAEYGLPKEPEFIEFYNGKIYYSPHTDKGELYLVEFSD